MRRLVLTLLAALLAAPAPARELASAPEARAIGFSADGRHFAYEVIDADAVAMAITVTIDVVDRTTGASAVGFPVVVRGEEDAVLADVEAEAWTEADPRLGDLSIVTGAARIAGRPLTDRGPDAPMDFVVSPTLPGPVPDLQPVYRLTAVVTPADTEACAAGATPTMHRVDVVLVAVDPESGRSSGPARNMTLPWPAAEDCPGAMRITDVYRVPAGEGRAPAVAVLLTGVAWAAHAETARVFATVLDLPE